MIEISKDLTSPNLINLGKIACKGGETRSGIKNKIYEKKHLGRTVWL
jgi:hypothetical protein